MEIDQWRRDYLRGGLRRKDLKSSPVEQFRQWLSEAVEAGLTDPSAMCLATADASGQPSLRIVLLKGFDERGFVFYTNLQSHKARDISANPKVSLLFPWHSLERQVIVYGRAEALSREEALAYFHTRPRDSQLAARASRQSEPLESRAVLEQQFQAEKEKYGEGEIPLPDFWGGYRVQPDAMEFWQGGANRLHDRFIYRREDGDQWAAERLSP
ncbi:pyridoxamine 5'-phosphate oxidase [Microbulbifer thermotolerans]|uniref:Pyridoxine/pyridoxamine 5'-phosphate oxidase n=1 Tax=Microbulbifer thermotolerans TaxID=252514 RepID=A0AB35HU74_MICTH|nr:pyridoxamine 5'-phosphate oxidase [Microbulbifer thermotolerans]MCX2778841.1 pyridoxamine 5'-phosphate oxidase [Microbulbifer thermotolerans]MCX2793727.1 pyridoxamine 5'-phosphate oxidase [Microbulbifer thermotolerans]MCX2800911.1 pyridoxamine 5'-phosphate oxidase [Microbulbifer thermotolerans]MCX2804146.1 pyridoxamine 5'-phosphate oxidase [Microbulbifer thermotolerans]MCX2834721.1 pyridoxamine 5'-phosphate oxidase [Microbulbifer thermotolerans]